MNNGGDEENEGYACLVVVVGVWGGRVEEKREYNEEGIWVILHKNKHL